MLNQIKALLNDAQLQQQIKQATDQAEAIKLIIAAGTTKGYDFSRESVSQALSALVSLNFKELSEQDLLAVSGGCCKHTCHTPEPD